MANATHNAPELGIDSFAAWSVGGAEGAPSPAEALRQLIARIELADQVGLDVFGIGEHHRKDFLDSAPPVILAAAALRTQRIKLGSAVTVLSAQDPVRVFQQFATLDLLTNGRAEMVVGRGSFTEAFPLFGLPLEDYDSLFADHLDLLLRLRDEETVHWRGEHRPALTGQGVYPRPVQAKLPIWLGVGGTPQSFVRAGMLGLPLMVAIIGGQTHRFRPLVDLYREAGRRAGHPEDQLKVGIHALGYVAPTDEEAAEAYFPGYAKTFGQVGEERGWGPITRRSYDMLLNDTGAALIGSPATVARKMRAHAEALGGVARWTFQMDVGSLSHEKLSQSIELLGREVKPQL